VRGLLSVPVLIVLGWSMAGLLWWHIRHGAAIKAMVPWTMTGMALVAIAMALLLAAVPAPASAQLVRAALLVEGVVGFWLLARHAPAERSHGRR
jgi:hypothetical protein